MDPRPRKRLKRSIYFRVDRGCLRPADRYAESQLRDRSYHIGDVVRAELKKLNSPGFNRLHHRIGQLCAANIEVFSGMDPHQVLKRLQWEGNIHCEEIGVQVPGIGLAMMRFPLSLSFEDLEDGERHEVVRAMCNHISAKYWPSMTPEAIEEMADTFPEEV